jgi:hypothetical protein
MPEEHWLQVEHELIRDHEESFEELSIEFFIDLFTEPGPTPQGRPGVSRR